MCNKQQDIIKINYFLLITILRINSLSSFFYFLKIYFIDYAITVVPFFSPFFPCLPCTRPPTCILPLQFMSMGHTYNFFGFSISYTILNLPLSILYLPFMLLIPCTFSPILPLPTDNPPWDLHFCGSVPVLVVCLVCFCFVLFFRFSC